MKSLPLLKQGAPTDIPQHRLSAGGAAPRMLVVPRLQRSTILAIRLPALPGWADVWLPALRAWVRFAVHCRLSHTLGAEALSDRVLYGTAGPVPFVRSFSGAEPGVLVLRQSRFRMVDNHA